MRREQLPLLLGFCLGSMGWNIAWPFLPLRVQAIGVGDLAEVARVSGLLAGGSNLITALLGPLWSTLGERYGFRLQIMRAHLGTGISFAALALARAPLELAAAGAMLGTLGGNYPHYMALAARRARPGEVGRVVGDMQAAGQVGGTIGPLIGGLVASQLGVPAAFAVTALVSASGALLIGLTVPPDRGQERAERAEGGLRAAFARPSQRWLMLLMVVADLGYQGIRPLLPVLISARVPDAAAVAAATGVAATLATGAGVAAALLIGRLGRRLSPRIVLVPALAVGAAAAFLIPVVDGLVPIVVLFVVGGFASGAVTPSIFGWLGRLSPSGGGFALLASSNMFVFAFGPAVMGQVSTVSLDLPFRVAAGMMLLAAALVVLRDLPDTPTLGSRRGDV